MDKATPEDLINRAFDAETFRKQGHQIVDLLADALSDASLGIPPVRSNQTPSESFEFWQDYLDTNFSTETLITKVIESLVSLSSPS